MPWVHENDYMKQRKAELKILLILRHLSKSGTKASNRPWIYSPASFVEKNAFFYRAAFRDPRLIRSLSHFHQRKGAGQSFDEESGFDEEVMERAIEKARAEDKAIIQNNERVAIQVVYRRENAEQIQEEVRARMTQEQTTAAYQEQKAAERRTWSNSVRAIEAQRVQSSLQATFEERVTKEVQRRISKMWEEVSGGAKKVDTGTEAEAPINQDVGASEGVQEVEEGGSRIFFGPSSSEPYNSTQPLWLVWTEATTSQKRASKLCKFSKKHSLI